MRREEAKKTKAHEARLYIRRREGRDRGRQIDRQMTKITKKKIDKDDQDKTKQRRFPNNIKTEWKHFILNAF